MLAQIFGQGIPPKAVADSINMSVWIEILGGAVMSLHVPGFPAMVAPS